MKLEELITFAAAAEEIRQNLTPPELRIEVFVPECCICGMTDAESDETYGYGLVDIQVKISRGEEGYSNAEKWLCADDLVMVTEWLVENGFGVHAHGGICFLEDTRCIGAVHYGECPTPEEQYGDDRYTY